MAIPRRIGEQLPKATKPELSDPIEKRKTQSGHSPTQIPQLETIPDDAFEEEGLPSPTLSPIEIKNMEEDELDALLGIDLFDENPKEIQKPSSTAEITTPKRDDKAPVSEPEGLEVQEPAKIKISPEDAFKDLEEYTLDDDDDDDEEALPSLEELMKTDVPLIEENKVIEQISENNDVISENGYTQDEINALFLSEDEEEAEENSTEKIIKNLGNRNKENEPEEDDLVFFDDDLKTSSIDSNDSYGDGDEEPNDEYELVFDENFGSTTKNTEEEPDDDEDEENENWGFSEVEENLNNDDYEEAFSDIVEDNHDNEEDSEFSIDENESDELEEEFELFPTRAKRKAKEPEPKPNEDDYDEEIENNEEIDPKSKKKSGLKAKFALIKAQILADAKGEKIPEALEDVDEPEDDADEQKPKRERSESKGKIRKPDLSKIFGFLSPIKKLYLTVVGIFFKILTGILGILSKLPLIGKLFKPILAATRILEKLAMFLPLVVLVGALILFSYLSVPRESIIELPDSGGAIFNEFSYDSKTGIASGTVTNTGEVIAEVKPVFTVHAIEPSLNPISWFIPKETKTCEGKLINIDIDSMKKVSFECKTSDGFIPRASGVLK